MYSALLGLAFAVGAPTTKDKDKPAAKIDGSWVIDMVEGKDANDLPKGVLTMTFAEGKVTIKMDGKADPGEKADFTVDASKKPAHIDIKPAGAPPELVIRGIYEIDGDTLKICFAKKGDRPTEFRADGEKGASFLKLKRLKEDK